MRVMILKRMVLLENNLAWVLPEDYCKKDPCNFNTEMFVPKVGQPLSNSWSTSSQPDFVRAFGRRKNSTKSPGQDFVHRVAQTLANSWSTPRQLNSPPHEKLQGSSLTATRKASYKILRSFFSSLGMEESAFCCATAYFGKPPG